MTCRIRAGSLDNESHRRLCRIAASYERGAKERASAGAGVSREVLYSGGPRESLLEVRQSFHSIPSPQVYENKGLLKDNDLHTALV